jgi:calcium-dependent protein kinase
MLSKKRLERIFQIFDKDGSGMISASELKETFGQSQDIDDDVWDELIKNADKDGNGEIDLKEFKEIMLQIM